MAACAAMGFEQTGGYNMPNAAEIVLWYPTRKYDTLQRALKDTGTELKAELTSVFDKLYERHIPEAERKEI